jgi:hypothetical protein
MEAERRRIYSGQDFRPSLQEEYLAGWSPLTTFGKGLSLNLVKEWRRKNV